jgi:hypothetical protein
MSWSEKFGQEPKLNSNVKPVYEKNEKKAQHHLQDQSGS